MILFFFSAEDNRSLAPTLRAAAVPLLDMETCRMSDVNGGRSQSILDTMICAGKFNFMREREREKKNIITDDDKFLLF